MKNTRTRYENIRLYGCEIQYDSKDHKYRYFVGDKAGTVIETDALSDMAYRLSKLQTSVYGY